MKVIILQAIIVVLLIIIVYNIYNRLIFTDEFLTGLWVASPDFCNASDISGMMIYLGPCTWNFTATRKAYLIMYHDNTVIANKKFMIDSYNMWDLFNPVYNTTATFDIELSDIEKSDESMEDAIEDPSEIMINKIMPESLKFSIDYSKCCIVFHDEEKIYAELYKDAVNSINPAADV